MSETEPRDFSEPILESSSSSLRGVFAIPPAPFAPSGDLDEEGLRRCVQFCLESKVHGLVLPVWASEFFFLTDAERLHMVEVVVETTAHQIPVVVGVSGTSSPHAAFFARQARRVRAEAVIAMPPYLEKATPLEIVDYFRVIAGEAELPVFIQNLLPPLGTPLSPAFLMRLIREIEGIEYVKEETLPAGHLITELLRYHEPRLKGVMGGQAGKFVIDEYRRGACGTMPACEVADIDVAIWNALEAGDEAHARQIWQRLLPLLSLEGIYGPHLWKEVLKRRGVLRSTTVRGFGDLALDEFDHLELNRILADLEPFFSVARPN